MEQKEPYIIDIETLKVLFEEHYSPLCEYAYYLVADEDAAKDLVQEFFFYCWQKKEQLRGVEDFRQYAYRAIKNASLNYLKRSKRTRHGSGYFLEQSAGEPEVPVESRQEEEVRSRQLWAAIDRLPEQRKQVFLLGNRDDMSYAEVAEKLGISVNTVKTQMRLAYQFLRVECRWLVGAIIWIYFKK